MVTKLPPGCNLWNTNNETFFSGEHVSGTVFIRCDHNAVSGVVRGSQCINGTWYPPIPDSLCAPLNNSMISTTCSFDGFDETSCSEPSLSGITAKMACPATYFRAEQSLMCDADGKWRSIRPWNKCRHHCGSNESNAPRWSAIVRDKRTGMNKCFANILNSVYAVTLADCVKSYEANQLNLWIFGPIYSIQSLEHGEKFSLIRIKGTFGFSESRMPICLDDGKGIHEYKWTAGALDPLLSCRNIRTDENGFYTGSRCLVNGTECINAFGSAQHQSSSQNMEGIKRRYLIGFADRAIKTGEDDNGWYDCDTTHQVPFSEPEYYALDFLDYAPRSV